MNSIYPLYFTTTCFGCLLRPSSCSLKKA